MKLKIVPLLFLPYVVLSLPPDAIEININIKGGYEISVKNGNASRKSISPSEFIRLVNKRNSYYVIDKKSGMPSTKIDPACKVLESDKLEKGSFFIYCPEDPKQDEFTVKIKNFREAKFKRISIPYDYDGDNVTKEPGYVYTVYNDKKGLWESLYVVYSKNGKLKYTMIYKEKDGYRYYKVIKYEVSIKKIPLPLPPPQPDRETPHPPPVPPMGKGQEGESR
ncbi:MAG: hypothetical protein DSY32_02870 [Aquifex sp.]|nr:MAG: hypothetical protein DSY32_02870 [Aquifex sp.]